MPQVWPLVGAKLSQTHSIRVPCPPEHAFLPIVRVGGEIGWYGCDFLWRLRGLLDRATGGPGFSPLRRDPARLAVGEQVDCWRVESFEEGRRLTMVFGMPMPGRGYLEFGVSGGQGRSVVTLTAIFEPRGLVGVASWYSLSLVHVWMFRRMLRGMAKAAMREWKAGSG